VDHDIRILGERNWRNFALNRGEPRKLLKKARTYAGLLVGWLVGLEARQLLRLFAPVYHTGSVKTH
jgi:hypothetical protein